MDQDISEYQALLNEYGEADLTDRDKSFIQWTMLQLGIQLDAPAGTVKTILNPPKRTCSNCEHSVGYPKHPDIGLKCGMLNVFFSPNFFCNMWQSRF